MKLEDAIVIVISHLDEKMANEPSRELADVRYIREPSNESNHHLAARLGVSETTIEDVKAGRKWKHVR